MGSLLMTKRNNKQLSPKVVSVNGDKGQRGGCDLHIDLTLWWVALSNIIIVRLSLYDAL